MRIHVIRTFYELEREILVSDLFISCHNKSLYIANALHLHISYYSILQLIVKRLKNISPRLAFDVPIMKKHIPKQTKKLQQRLLQVSCMVRRNLIIGMSVGNFLDEYGRPCRD